MIEIKLSDLYGRFNGHCTLEWLVLSGEKETALTFDPEVCKIHDVYDILPDFFGVTSCM